MNLFLCVESVTTIQEIMKEAMENHRFSISGIMTEGLPAVSALKKQEIDVCVLEVNVDALTLQSFMKEVREQIDMETFRLLCLFRHLNKEMIAVLTNYHVRYFLVEPYTTKQLIEAISLEEECSFPLIVKEESIEGSVVELMVNLGLPPHLNGFHYIKTAVILSFESNEKLKQTMKHMYSLTAKKHNTTSVRVEKSIRTAVDYAYRKQPERICIYHTKPTSSQVIYYISEKLKENEKRK